MTVGIISLPFIASENVEEEVRRIAKEATQHVILLDHTKDRMDEREITVKQVLNVLRLGEMLGAPAWDTEKERGWKCKFSRVTAGIKVTVVPKLVKRDDVQCLIITVWGG